MVHLLESAQVVLSCPRPGWVCQCGVVDLVFYTSYVSVPYDLLMKYICRAEGLVLRMPERQRLQHVETLDQAERGEWAHRLANSSLYQQERRCNAGGHRCASTVQGLKLSRFRGRRNPTAGKPEKRPPTKEVSGHEN